VASLIVAPNVLRWARESIGFDLNEAADISSQPAEQIQGWEHGTSRPTLAQLKRLASAYRRQLAALLLREPPADDEPRLADFRRRADYSPPRLSPGVHLAIREVRRHQLALREVASALQLPALPVGSAESTDADALANDWRQRIGISVEVQRRWRDTYVALQQWRDAVEAVGTIVLQLPFGDEGIRGISIADSVVPAIAINSDDAATGRSFTLFHELAHLLFGKVGICEPRSALRYEATSLEEERLCNRFAGAFLVPINELAQEEAAQQIAAMPRLPSDSDFGPLRGVFKVSSQVIWYRLRDAGLIDLDRYFALWSIWASQAAPEKRQGGRGQDRAERAIARYGRRFVIAILDAERRGYVDFTEVLRYTRVRADEVPRLEALATNRT
jgi:Zn-dependent peptidase ImmA (M78 family)/transcriptional regulator with XRE-family HTH domain